MKIEKDVLIAIVVGLLVGGAAAFCVFFLPDLLAKLSPGKKQLEIAEKEILPSPAPNFFLDLQQPEEEAVSPQQEITVKGQTTPQALVAVVSPTDEAVVEADGQGNFSAQILLQEGANQITVTAYNQAKQKTETLIVYYTEEKI